MRESRSNEDITLLPDHVALEVSDQEPVDLDVGPRLNSKATTLRSSKGSLKDSRASSKPRTLDSLERGESNADEAGAKGVGEKDESAANDFFAKKNNYIRSQRESKTKNNGGTDGLTLA